MKLMVTGGSGFLGRYVLRAAAQRGHESFALTRSTAAAALVASLGARPMAGDLDIPARLGEVFASSRCDALVNLASLGFGHAPAIVAAALEADIGRAVFVSTTAVASALATPTTQVRIAAEHRIRQSGLDWTILRPTMIYGAPGDRNLSRLLPLLGKAPAFPVPGGGSGLQQPVHVADLAGAVLNAAERPQTAGGCYDVAGPEPLSFASLLRTAASTVTSRTRFFPVPMAPAVLVARVYSQLSRHPRISAEQLLRLAEDKAFCIDDAVGDLGFTPRPFGVGIMAEARAMGLAGD
jgi:uncharacterized protein YbjT (DUF2867 family)